MPKKKSEQLKEICVTIGEEIRKRRSTIGMTRKEFGSKLDFSQASVSNIEKGKQSLTAGKLWQVALVLGCSPSEILPPIPEEYKMFEKELAKMDKKTRQWGYELLKPLKNEAKL